MENKSLDFVSLDMMFEAPLKDVWWAWTEPGLVLQWFGSDPDGQGIDARLNVVPGGHYEIHFRDSDQSDHTCYGVYNEVVEFSKLTFTWRWKSEPDVESQVTIRFIPSGTQTQMQFEHRDFGYQSVHGYEEGWKGAFSKLQNILSSQTAKGFHLDK